MLCVSLHEIIHGRMHPELRRRQREDQPSAPGIDRSKVQDLATLLSLSVVEAYISDAFLNRVMGLTRSYPP
jgi:hypothetical protein